MTTTLRPGDHVIVQAPAYHSLSAIARLIGCDVTFRQMDEERGWSPDLDALQDLVRPATKAVIITSPHTPTGYQFPKEDFLSLARFAEDRDITLFSDEGQRFLEHRADDRLPAIG